MIFSIRDIHILNVICIKKLQLNKKSKYLQKKYIYVYKTKKKIYMFIKLKKNIYMFIKLKKKYIYINKTKKKNIFF